MEAGMPFQILAVRIRNEDTKRFKASIVYQPRRDADPYGGSMVKSTACLLACLEMELCQESLSITEKGERGKRIGVGCKPTPDVVRSRGPADEIRRCAEDCMI
ncbi:jg6992 [Pararge aegeria aegeria]|uniref:Jg6992 protein n=1 Tax=Pararge aegeria aegeria TaxID=348720 RepID=A0A8S4SGE0_9NEOP|nr:jg6992 [Pararge aegeria aegeria]